MNTVTITGLTIQGTKFDAVACCGPACPSMLMVMVEQVSKMPTRWLCPICEMNERDAMTEAQASTPTSRALRAIDITMPWGKIKLMQMAPFYANGEAVSDEGKGLSACPFPDGSDEWAAWVCGWRAAYERNS